MVLIFYEKKDRNSFDQKLNGLVIDVHLPLKYSCLYKRWRKTLCYSQDHSSAAALILYIVVQN